VPLVVHFHGYDAYQRSVLEAFERRYRRVFEYADAIVVVSEHMRGQVVGLGARAESVHVIPCGVDPQAFSQARPGEAPARCLAVGRFVEKKAPHLLMLVMSRVLRAVPEARLTMVGSGPLLGPCRQLASALGIAHAIEFVGPLGHDAVAGWMREARAFLQHSITAADGDREGTPVSVMEALMAGLPVVATRHTGIAETVVDGRTGFLVDELDVAGMADRVVRLLQDPAEAAALGTAARAFALEHCAEAESLARLRNVLAAAAGSTRKR
jgi:glycosyltransferase involved in cell wall biosynthesis